MIMQQLVINERRAVAGQLLVFSEPWLIVRVELMGTGIDKHVFIVLI